MTDPSARNRVTELFGDGTWARVLDYLPLVMEAAREAGKADDWDDALYGSVWRLTDEIRTLYTGPDVLIGTVPMTDRELRNCKKCGKPHYPRESVGMVTYTDPDDGHGYFPESWEAVARRFETEVRRLRARWAERPRFEGDRPDD